MFYLSDFSDLTIVIPTLNEEKNIQRLIRMLAGTYPGVSVMVSDDGSIDGTKDAVVKLGRSNKRILFLDRRKSAEHGLTASVIDAAKLVSTKKMIVMDADMQHPYEKVRSISSALDDHDIVIGVRRRIKDWGVQRRIVSVLVSSFAFVVFSIRGRPACRDMMTGFFGIRTDLFKSIISKNRKRFVYRGYKVVLDILRVVDSKASISEIEYDTFHQRRYGSSKLSFLGMNHAYDTLQSILK